MTLPLTLALVACGTDATPAAAAPGPVPVARAAVAEAPAPRPVPAVTAAVRVEPAPVPAALAPAASPGARAIPAEDAVAEAEPAPPATEPAPPATEPAPPATEPAPPATEPAAAGIAAAGVPAEEPAAAPAGGAHTYDLVPSPNGLSVVVRYERGTLGAALAHDHVVVATRYAGAVTWDPADPTSCAVAVDVPVSGLRVDPPGARARAGLEGDAPVEDQPQIEENFRSKRQLDAERFPVLTFRSTGCRARTDGKVDVSGVLAIHGAERPTTVAMDLRVEGDRLRARGAFTADHADFAMTPFSAAMGAVRNAEPLAFTLDLTGAVSR